MLSSKRKTHKNRWVSKRSPIKNCVGSKQRKSVASIATLVVAPEDSNLTGAPFMFLSHLSLHLQSATMSSNTTGRNPQNAD